MKKTLIALLVSLTCLTSCSYYAYYCQTGSAPLTETKPDVIKIYSGDIDKEYVVIGSVAADVNGDADAAVKYLKKKASKLGADAIIKIELTKINSFSQRTGISGVAVRMK
jgi:hypothetical protein